MFRKYNITLIGIETSIDFKNIAEKMNAQLLKVKETWEEKERIFNIMFDRDDEISVEAKYPI
jgi:hypothetical protein